MCSCSAAAGRGNAKVPKPVHNTKQGGEQQKEKGREGSKCKQQPHWSHPDSKVESCKRKSTGKKRNARGPVIGTRAAARGE